MISRNMLTTKKSLPLISACLSLKKHLLETKSRYPDLIISSYFHSSSFILASNDDTNKSKALMHPFEFVKKKEKETFLECIRTYESRCGPRNDYLQFIKLALKYMDQFGVNKDLEVYKKLMNIFPKGKMLPKNAYQVIFWHYAKDQFCAVEILDKMENNGVIPDPEVEIILKNVFGKFAQPLTKLYAMNYWLPKFKNLTPWPVPKPLPNDTLELAKAAIERITSVDYQNKITVFRTEDVQDSIDKTWIVSAISLTQGELLKKHNKKKAIFVEGPYRTWLGDRSIEYFILRAKVPELRYNYPEFDLDDVSNIRIPQMELDHSAVILAPSVHEQDDGIILSVCATGTSTKDSLLSWIRCLQKEHSVLEEIPVVFTLKKSSEEAIYITENVIKEQSGLQSNDQKRVDDR